MPGVPPQLALGPEQHSVVPQSQFQWCHNLSCQWCHNLSCHCCWLPILIMDNNIQLWHAGLGERLLGRWLGVSHRVSSLMSYWILTKTGARISQTTVQRVTNLEAEVDENKQLFQEFNNEVTQRLRDGDMPAEGNKPNPEDWADMFEHDEDFQREFDRVINSKDVPEAEDNFTANMFNDTSWVEALSLWADMFEHDEDFQWEFDRVVNSKDVPEAEDNFTPDMFDDTSWSKRLASSTVLGILIPNL